MTTGLLRIELRPSRLLVTALVGAHAGAATLVFIALSQWGLRILVACALGASLWHAIRHAALRATRSAISEIELRSDGSARVRRRDGRREEVRLSHSTFVAPWLAILVFSRRRWRPARSAVVLRDSVSPEEFRLLRVWLYWR
jgi:hypothetical protein